MPLCKETWIISFLLKGSISLHPCLEVKYPLNPNGHPWSSPGPDCILLLACGHCPGYYVCTERVEVLFNILINDTAGLSAPSAAL